MSETRALDNMIAEVLHWLGHAKGLRFRGMSIIDGVFTTIEEPPSEAENQLAESLRYLYERRNAIIYERMVRDLRSQA